MPTSDRRRRWSSPWIGATVVILALLFLAAVRPAGAVSQSREVAVAAADQSVGPVAARSAPTVTRTRIRPTAKGSVARFHWYAQGWNPTVSDSKADAHRYRIVILEPSSTRQRARIRAQGTGTRLLFYKNALSTLYTSRPTALKHLSTGVDYYTAARRHPDWFLRGPDGQRLTRHYTSSQTDYLMDIGSTSYQDQVVANILAEARAGHWDGVFLDDVLPTMKWWLPSGNVSDVVRYPTDARFQAAFRSFLRHVGTKVRAAGLMVIANTCCNPSYHQRADWARYLSGTMDEGFVNPTNGESSPLAFASSPGSWNDWRSYLREVRDAERAGKILLANTRGPIGDAARARFALGTVLLAAAGETSFEYHWSDTDASWTTDEKTAVRLGAPRGSYSRLRSGLYRRVFAHGVVVNPRRPGASPVGLALGGSFSGSGLARVSHVSLPSVSALILLRNN